MKGIEDGIPGEAGSGQLTAKQIVEKINPNFNQLPKEIQKDIIEGTQILLDELGSSDAVITRLKESKERMGEEIKKKIKNKK